MKLKFETSFIIEIALRKKLSTASFVEHLLHSPVEHEVEHETPLLT